MTEPKQSPTPLELKLAARIGASGPISVADYMAACLSDPQWGYYTGSERTGRAPIGRHGDFITSPEVSQMFGELLGLWALDEWTAAARSSPMRLVELGPGHGTAMADAVRAIHQISPAMTLDLHLVETSHQLRQHQADALSSLSPAWHDHLDDVPDSTAVMFANELFDALPARQFVQTSEAGTSGWCERMVTRDSTQNVLMFTSGPFLPVAEYAALQLPDPAHYAPGDIVAQSKPSIDLASAIGRRIMTTGGAALFVDYGFATPRGHIAVGDTLQAMSGHSHVGVFDRPGDVDLTIHVDFAALAVAAESAGACAWGPVNQGIFLQRLGIDVRAQQLAASADLDGQQAIAAARDRLVADDQMGTLFKVVAITGDDAPVPAGFTSDDKFE